MAAIIAVLLVRLDRGSVDFISFFSLFQGRAWKSRARAISVRSKTAVFDEYFTDVADLVSTVPPFFYLTFLLSLTGLPFVVWQVCSLFYF